MFKMEVGGAADKTIEWPSNCSGMVSRSSWSGDGGLGESKTQLWMLFVRWVQRATRYDLVCGHTFKLEKRSLRTISLVRPSTLSLDFVLTTSPVLFPSLVALFVEPTTDQSAKKVGGSLKGETKIEKYWRRLQTVNEFDQFHYAQTIYNHIDLSLTTLFVKNPFLTFFFNS